MSNITTVGVDLAKNVIQVCIFYKNKVLSNTEMTPSEFTLWLTTHKRSIVVFEACGTSNYWKQKATTLGHDARLISAKLVGTVRQNQKTDKCTLYFREKYRATTASINFANEGVIG